MKLKRLLLVFNATLLLLSCSESPKSVLIPEPVNMVKHDGRFKIDSNTLIFADSTDSSSTQNAILLVDLLNSKGIGCRFLPTQINSSAKGIIELTKNGCPDSLGNEGYAIDIEHNRITIRANRSAGFFYAIQTLRQLMPANFEKDNFNAGSVALPCLTIVDKPRFSWRGLNLDCCRHFMTKEFVKRYIDLLAYHKMNVLHWHLTEDQGWRIEIKKYPRLTEVGAWRTLPDGTRYGGFYTQDDIREVVAYAAKRHVMVVPEIEMPGHSVAAIASYPWLSCTGDTLQVETNWGVFKDIYCAGSEQTFQFLEDVLFEVADLFPAPYVHIGGDEAPKFRWENCPKCTVRLKNEGLNSYEELQRYFISHIAKFLETKGKTIIGWDEILEGGRPHNATIQAWRGLDRVAVALQANAPVIVSPTSHCYFDYPVEVTSLEKVYGFNPIPKGILPELQPLVIGGECNMWTERAPQETVDSKVFRRLLAISEVLWTYPIERSYPEFLNRVWFHYSRLSAMGVNYGFEKSAIEFKSAIGDKGNSIIVELERGKGNLEVRYTTNGVEPTLNSTLYRRPLELSSTKTIKAAAFNNVARVGEVLERIFVVSKNLDKPIELGFKSSGKYLGGGPNAIVDGRLGTIQYNDGIWQAVQGEDMMVTIDLGSEQLVHGISLGFLQNIPSWIFLPLWIDAFISDDNKTFEQFARLDCPEGAKYESTIIYRFVGKFNNPFKGRYIRFLAHNPGPCPRGTRLQVLLPGSLPMR